MINKKNKKALTLVETFVSIAIISLLILIIVQISLIFSKLSKRATYLSDSDIKTKEVALKIEKAIYNLKYVNYFNTQFLYTSRITKIKDIIYTIYNGKTEIITTIYLNPIEINKKYYRTVFIKYYKKNFNNYNINYLYLPEETFWKIEEILYKKNDPKYYLGNYVLYNPISINIYKVSNVNRKLYDLQRFKIHFYFYSVDKNNRPYNLYKKDKNFLVNEYKKKYFTKKSYFMIFDYLYY